MNIKPVNVVINWADNKILVDFAGYVFGIRVTHDIDQDSRTFPATLKIV